MSSTKILAKSLAKCTPVFLALGEPVRQQIILVLADVDEISVGDLTREVHLSRPAVSHHLKKLLDAGLVRNRRVGTVNYYALTMGASVTLLDRFVEEARLCLST